MRWRAALLLLWASAQGWPEATPSRAGRPADRGPLSFHAGTEDAAAQAVLAAAKGPEAVLTAIDRFCWERQWMMNLGPAKAAALDRLLGRLAPEALSGTVLEFGSYIGYSAVVLARRLGPGGRVLAVEPHPALGKLLQTVVGRAGLAGKVELLAMNDSQAVQQLQGRPVAVLVLDHLKELYLPTLQAAEAAGLLRAGSLVVADNAVVFSDHPAVKALWSHMRESGLYKDVSVIMSDFEYDLGPNRRADGLLVGVYAPEDGGFYRPDAAHCALWSECERCVVQHCGWCLHSSRCLPDGPSSHERCATESFVAVHGKGLECPRRGLGPEFTFVETLNVNNRLNFGPQKCTASPKAERPSRDAVLSGCLAGDVHRVDRMLKRGGAVNPKNHSLGCLHLATGRLDAALTALCLEHGADSGLLTKERESAYHYAADAVELTKQLVRKMGRGQQYVAYSKALRDKSASALKLGWNVGMNLATVEQILHPDHKLNLALFKARLPVSLLQPGMVSWSLNELLELTSIGHVKAIEMLAAKSRAGLNAQASPSGSTPLHIAVANGDATLTAALLKLRPNLSLQDWAGRSPLHIAAAGGNAEIVKLLMRRGADTVVDNDGRTAHDVACLFGHTAVLTELNKTGGTSQCPDRPESALQEWWPTCPIPHLHASELSQAEFQRNHLTIGRPVLLRGAADHWPAMKNWTRRTLSSRLGKLNVEVSGIAYPSDYGGLEGERTSLEQFLSNSSDSLWEQSNRAGEPLYLFKGLRDEELALIERDIQTPAYLDPKRSSVWSVLAVHLSAGRAGTGSHVHYHTGVLVFGVVLTGVGRRVEHAHSR